MLSIAAMAKGQGRYYLDLAREDYYLQGGEPPGRWMGSGAELLGLSGIVEKADLQNLLSGFAPDGRPLVQNAGHDKHQPGWDLTFSAPKSVSVLWSQADPFTRAKIQAAHHAAIQAALRYIEEEATLTRRGKGGNRRERAGLIIATFEHGTSRALDPQLHTHALVVNVAVRSDGTTGTLLSKPFYQHKMTAGALYRAELSHRLTRDLGVVCRPEKSWFEIEGVSQPLIQEFSKRRQKIEEELKTRNLESASAAAFATLNTREAKDSIPPREELFRKWQETGRAFGFVLEHVFSFRSKDQTQVPLTFNQVLKDTLTDITRQHNYFSEKELTRGVAERAQAGMFSAEQIREGVKAALNDPKRITVLGEHKTEIQYTTPEVLALEKKMLKDASTLAQLKRPGVPILVARSVEKSYLRERSPIMAELKYHVGQLRKAAVGRKTRPINRQQVFKDLKATLTREQVKAFRHLTQKRKGGIRILEGQAGTGKSFLFRAVREAYERTGYRVLGVTVSGKAARELQNASGVRTITIAALEFLMRHPLRHSLSHHAKQVLKTALCQQPMERFRFDKKTLLIIDEASMVSTQSLAPIIREARRAGAILILSGDKAQLPAIERGGSFAHLVNTVGAAVLKRIIRQRKPRDREIVSDMAEGKTQEVLKNLAERGLLSVMPDRDKAKEELVKKWTQEERLTRDKALILCGTNADVIDLNQRCQDARKGAGELKGRDSIRLKEQMFYQGDRVVFLKNSRPLGINNGDTATITSISPAFRRISVRLDDGRRAVIPLRNYADIALGYAITTHKAQGTTIENAYVLAGGSMQDHQLSYVQLSRARGTTRVFTDELEAGPDLSQLARQMSESREKRLATDILRNVRPTPSQTRV